MDYEIRNFNVPRPFHKLSHLASVHIDYKTVQKNVFKLELASILNRVKILEFSCVLDRLKKILL